MDDFPLHLLDEILFRLDVKSLAMMLCTNRFIKSHISNDPHFEIGYFSRARLDSTEGLFYTFSGGAPYVFYQPSVSSCVSMSPGKSCCLAIYCILGSCSGLLLLYMSGFYVVNPVTKSFQLLDHSGSKLLATLVNGYSIVSERAMCVGFAVDRSRVSKRFKIICILEMQTMYKFEISDGDSWRLSETTITTNSKCDLTKRMKPVYLEGTLYWLRNDGSIIGFNLETEQARFISSIFHKEPDTKLFFAPDYTINRLILVSGTKDTISVYTLIGDTKWVLAKQIKNVLMMESEFEYWNVVTYDGKHMVVKDKDQHGLNGVARVYDIEANSWGPWWSTKCPACSNLDFYKFTPFLSFLEQTEVVVAYKERRMYCLAKMMELIDATK